MYSTATGYIRPPTWMTGARPKASENFSVSRVAEVMINLSSGRAARRVLVIPSRKSMFRLRSWASSMISVSYS